MRVLLPQSMPNEGGRVSSVGSLLTAGWTAAHQACMPPFPNSMISFASVLLRYTATKSQNESKKGPAETETSMGDPVENGGRLDQRGCIAHAWRWTLNIVHFRNGTGITCKQHPPTNYSSRLRGVASEVVRNTGPVLASRDDALAKPPSSLLLPFPRDPSNE